MQIAQKGNANVNKPPRYECFKALDASSGISYGTVRNQYVVVENKNAKQGKHEELSLTVICTRQKCGLSSR